MEYCIKAPLANEVCETLSAGDFVKLSGIIYTARDAAHKRMVESFEKTGKLPIALEGQIIYYAGPAPAAPGQVIGSAGPTTSGRMDAYAPILLNLGLKMMIGKGSRNKDVIASMMKNKALYLGATGGAGALLASHIKKAEIAAYEDLGTEAVYRLEVEDFPAVVIIDTKGNNLYELEQKKYKIEEDS